MARPKFIPTTEQRRQVQAAAGLGLRHSDNAVIIGVAEKTLRKHFRKELQTGLAIASHNVRKTLYDMATGGKNIAATIFWLKTHGGLREQNDGPRPSNPPPILIEVAQPTPRPDDKEKESSPGDEKEDESLDLPDEDKKCE